MVLRNQKVIRMCKAKNEESQAVHRKINFKVPVQNADSRLACKHLEFGGTEAGHFT